MSTLKTAETLLALERDRQERKIRADTSLSFEKEELAIRRLGQRFDEDRKRIERGAQHDQKKQLPAAARAPAAPQGVAFSPG